jgi:hypothetical protein
MRCTYMCMLEFLLWYMLWLLLSELPRLDFRRALRSLFSVRSSPAANAYERS